MTVILDSASTLPLPAAATVLPLQPEDFADIGRVAYQTGFFGESAARYFADALLFADLWAGPYFAGEDRLGFTARLRGETVGYIVGLSNGERYGVALRRTLLRRVLPGLLRGRYRRPFQSLIYWQRALRFPTAHAPLDLYPAHLHINLLPAARGSGLGRILLSRFLEELRSRGVPGVQLSTTCENQAALRLYERAGFQVYLQRESPLWTPWLGRAAVHVVMVRDLRTSPDR
ncbi:GNAT family N-acetyltransferase [Deinococcus peraridilitoris]|uniref:Acetyltransferase n=1 Tax=Deinococcus peraridilitoris (strain DSM 19664 / LMG 22246 / CIP 109416 / KR-200) TaxID=937777 RepID=L0A0W1_DEIPD|nr:GNAT family N-acetyltransferase [Deinococcus peraridilitoris]AFZ67486.1 acetyltransferase [Deinococcus peraridilitoris DSM 19664]